MSSTIDVVRAGLIAQGIPAYGDMYGVTADPATAVGGKMLQLMNPTRVFTGKDAATLGLIAAEAGMTTGQNDTLLLTPESHSLATALTWDLNETNLCGLCTNQAVMNQRTRIGHSANIASMITVSGYGNTFANLYVMYGRGSATNLNLLTVSGDRNTFVNCHFGGPMHATEGGTATFNIATVTGTENRFKNCVFGISTIDISAAVTGVVFGGSGYDPRTTFEDCLFLFRGASGGAASYFIQTAAGVGEAFAQFKNCLFWNTGGTAFTYGVNGVGTAAQKLAFPGSFFIGCTDVVAAAYEAYCYFAPSNTPINQITGGASVALFNGLSCPPDVS